VRNSTELSYFHKSVHVEQEGTDEKQYIHSGFCSCGFSSRFFGFANSGIAGLLVGLAIDAAREGGDMDGTRVCFIAGTFAGLGLGIYQATRESAQEKHSLLSIEPGKTVSLHLTLPEAAVQRQVNATGREYAELAYKLRVIGVSF
jgi:hypothetical protein